MFVKPRFTLLHYVPHGRARTDRKIQGERAVQQCADIEDRAVIQRRAAVATTRGIRTVTVSIFGAVPVVWIQTFEV